MPRASSSTAGVERLLYRPAEAAAALQISVRQLHKLIQTGFLPSVRLGKSLRVPVAALRELLRTGAIDHRLRRPERGDRARRKG